MLAALFLFVALFQVLPSACLYRSIDYYTNSLQNSLFSLPNGIGKFEKPLYNDRNPCEAVAMIGAWQLAWLEESNVQTLQRRNIEEVLRDTVVDALQSSFKPSEFSKCEMMLKLFVDRNVSRM
ncbi:Serine--tRNA ligase [Trichinella spiralis]|uniref:Serine--tRNA ligase n=2 Tax=Trichinella spiralis TaxID=6334 RepID=A0ABR3KJX2_TRISP|nr:DNA primase small subunit [Trichinella spiralis]KRY31895.1 hypothetical protein T01_2558 [Trichinella spiralis]